MPCCLPCVDEGTSECRTGTPLERVDGTLVTSSAHEDVLDGPPERLDWHCVTPNPSLEVVLLCSVEHIYIVTFHDGILDCTLEIL